MDPFLWCDAQCCHKEFNLYKSIDNVPVHIFSAVFVRKNLANTLADMSGPLPDMGYSPRISIPM